MTEVFYYDTTTINDQEYFLATTNLGIAYLGLKSQIILPYIWLLSE